MRQVTLMAVLAAAFGVVACAPAGAANIRTELRDFHGRKVTHILVRGEFRDGDEKTFARSALDLDEAVVLMDSPGGDLAPGIEIGKAIRLKGFTTLVRKGRPCESACALAWMAGKPAMMEANNLVGFHAVWEDDDKGSVSSVGNAIVGAYVNALGLSDKVVEYVTAAQPDDMKYLTFSDALAIGLPVERFIERVAPAGVPDGKPQREPPLAAPAASSARIGTGR